MEKRALGHPDLPDPGHFSRGVETTGGRTIYLAGQAPLDASGNVAAGDMAAQTARCLEKISMILEANDSSMDDVVSLTFFVTDISRFGETKAARDAHFSGPIPPAMSGVEVSALSGPDWLVEVDGIAVAN